MVEINVFSQINEDEVGEMEVSDELLSYPFHNDLIYRAVRAYRTNGRAGTASTKDRSEVTGSNRKPWRQKGTGRARHGSRQSPLWVGGGTTFGPKPKEYKMDLPQKMKKRAIRSALSTRFREDAIKFIDEIRFEEPKTRRGAEILERLEFGDSVLIILSENEDNWRTRKTFANLPDVTTIPARKLNTYSILKNEGLLITEEALKELESRLLDIEE